MQHKSPATVPFGAPPGDYRAACTGNLRRYIRAPRSAERAVPSRQEESLHARRTPATTSRDAQTPAGTSHARRPGTVRRRGAGARGVGRESAPRRAAAASPLIDHGTRMPGGQTRWPATPECAESGAFRRSTGRNRRPSADTWSVPRGAAEPETSGRRWPGRRALPQPPGRPLRRNW